MGAENRELRFSSSLGRNGGKFKKLVTAARNIDESVIITDAARKIVFVNPAAERMLGYRAKELIGKLASRFFENIPGNPPDLAAKIAAEASPDRIWEGVVYDRDKEGNVFAVRLKLAEVHNGFSVGYVGISSVIEDDASAKSRAADSPPETLPGLAVGIAHDFNNLLQVIDLNLSSLEMTNDIPGKEAREKLATARKSLAACASLSNHLLTLCRSGSEPPCRFDLDRVVQETADLFRKSVPKQIRIISRLFGNLPPIHGHPAQIHRVLFNLGKNALEAMGGKGEVVFNTAVVDSPPRSLDCSGRRPFAMVSVTDHGPGIPAGLEESIFEPFFTTRDKKGGTGLGLAVSKAIIEAHGGFIRLAESRGKGGVFEVYLPAAE